MLPILPAALHSAPALGSPTRSLATWHTTRSVQERVGFLAIPVFVLQQLCRKPNSVAPRDRVHRALSESAVNNAAGVSHLPIFDVREGTCAPTIQPSGVRNRRRHETDVDRLLGWRTQNLRPQVFHLIAVADELEFDECIPMRCAQERDEFLN